MNITEPKIEGGVAMRQPDETTSELLQESVAEELKKNFIREKNKLEEEKREFEKEKREFYFRKKMDEKRLAEQERLFQMKWKILENEWKALAKEKEEFAAEQERNAKEAEKYKCCNSARVEDASIFFSGVNNELALKKRYKELIKIYHPDNLAGDTVTLQLINKTYDALKKQFTA